MHTARRAATEECFTAGTLERGEKRKQEHIYQGAGDWGASLVGEETRLRRPIFRLRRGVRQVPCFQQS